MTVKILTVGHSCIDVMYHVAALPKSDEKIAASNFEISIGGNAANVAAAFCDLGGRADICSVIGSQSHPMTRVLVSLLHSKSIGTKYLEFNEAADCSVSTILITPDGDRTIINHTSSRLQSAIVESLNLSEYDMILGDSYRLPLVNTVFDMAKPYNIKTMLDVDQPTDWTLLPKCDYVWFSKAAVNTVNTGLPTLQEHFGGVVGLTCGSMPIYWMGVDHILKRHDPKPIKVVNSLGAGDVWRARLALEICQNTDLNRAVELASQTAGEYIQSRHIEEILKR